MFRSLSTKLLAAVLAAVVLPFAGFAFFLESQIADRMVRDFVRENLLGLAGDLAREIDSVLRERREDLVILADDAKASWALAEATDADAPAFGAEQELREIHESLGPVFRSRSPR